MGEDFGPALEIAKVLPIRKELIARAELEEKLNAAFARKEAARAALDAFPHSTEMLLAASVYAQTLAHYYRLSNALDELDGRVA